jgi:hypothetical protein
MVKRLKTLKEINFSFVLNSDNEVLIEKSGQSYSKASVIGEGT